MYIHLNLSSGVPIYQQIVRQVKYLVVTGSLGERDKLPSVRKLAADLAINPTTVVKAYDELEHAGVIYRRQGQGCFVSDDASHISAKEKRRLITEMARRLAVEGLSLGLESDQIVSIIQRELEKILKQSET
ncbi:GntR family transcriptional regulator [Candidatus Hydrogenedentota bacterium]